MNFKIVNHPQRRSWLVVPVPSSREDAYVIEALEESEAIRIAKDLVARKMPPPEQSMVPYLDPEIDDDGLKIFRLRYRRG